MTQVNRYYALCTTRNCNIYRQVIGPSAVYKKLPAVVQRVKDSGNPHTGPNRAFQVTAGKDHFVAGYQVGRNHRQRTRKFVK
jgi:hypothetical protein